MAMAEYPIITIPLTGLTAAFIIAPTIPYRCGAMTVGGIMNTRSMSTTKSIIMTTITYPSRPIPPLGISSARKTALTALHRGIMTINRQNYSKR